MDRRETERILAAIRRADAAHERVALATIVRVRGSAYRREGAHLVVHADGSYECLVSGGCLEPAVVDAAARVIATGEPIVACYDLAEDSVWALGVGCSGEVDIRIERVDDEPVMRAWLGVLERSDAAVLVTPLDGSGGRMIVSPGGDVAGGLARAGLQAEAVAHARQRLEARYPHSGSEWFGDVELFFEVSEPPPELVIFGAGDDAVPLARQAFALGFVVTVVDVRDAFLTEERFPHATLVPAHTSRFAADVPLGSRSFVVIMNHHLERDEHSLRTALASQAPYVGVLGPLSRYQRLLSRLRAQQIDLDAARLACVRSPVGLALGSETPEEIAVSILGEMIAIRRGFAGGFLNGLDASLHAVSDSNRSFARS